MRFDVKIPDGVWIENDNFYKMNSKGHKDILHVLICQECGGEYLSHNKKGKFCTNKCSRTNNIRIRQKKTGNTQDMKMCPKCKKLLPRTDFKVNESRADNTAPYCKICDYKFYRERYLENSNPLNGRHQGIVEGKKKCSTCQEWLDLDEFSKNKSAGDGYQRVCKKCSSIRNSISHRIRLSIKNKNGRSWEKLVGYTLNDLVSHLQKLFKPKMTWENYSYKGWHIDHKRPVSSFNFTSFDCEDFKECWSLNNLQPLWAEENFKKGNKWNE